jgi:translation initiation factor IF-2
VVEGEAGGITQHIGAYQVRHGAWNVTFLDTPGHEAFTAMRARGAHLTDVVVLVVAADDGVMPQTIEAINHAKAAGVQIVVALNKIDLPGVDVNRIYAQLAEQELVPAEWGGETDVVKTSATTGEGIEELLSHLSTLSELMDLKADPDVPAQGAVIEAQLREGRGVVAQVLVREGTLKVGQVVVCGPGAGRVRTLMDYRGKRIKEADPGTPVEVVGLDRLPNAGERLYVMDGLSEAKRIAEEINMQRREDALSDVRKPRTLEELLKGSEEGEVPELNVIVKADVQGSVDVLKRSLGEFPTEKARLRILHAAVGAISEADVELARASGAVLIGFHVVADDRARQLVEQCGVELRLYRVIYDLHDDLHKALEGLLEPEEKEESRGKVEVRQVFNITRVGRIAGCFVTEGVVARNHKTRLVRDGRVVAEGHGIGSLRRFKDDAREVRAGFECGIKIDGYDDLKPGDVIEAYEIIEVAQSL